MESLKNFMEIDDKEKEKLIPSMTSKALAAHVVVYKALGMHRGFAIKCLQELAIRKAKGDDFDFNDFINQELNKLPKSESPDYNGIFSMFKNASNDFLKNGKNK